LRTRRYELALMRESVNVARATDEHAEILAALRNNNLKAACAALKQNMQSGFAPIAAWLQQREQKTARSRRLGG
jgi:DNA-binding GntR family transcriptional regulator